MKNRWNYLAATLTSCLLFLAACGSGGPAMPAFTPAPAPAAPAAATNGGPVSFQSANMTVTYPAAASMGTAVNGGRSGNSTAASGQGATVTLTTDASGNLSKVVLNIPAAGFTQPFDANTGLSSLSSPLAPGTIANLFGGNEFGFLTTTSYLVTQTAGTQSLSASAYGLWGSNDSFNASRFGGFAIGSLTPPASVPTTGSATFNGSTIAIGANDVNTFVGSAQIIANFSANSVTANLTNFSGQGGTTIPNLTGTASISGNSYAGSLSGMGLTGTINGNFYGSAAQETAGVWQVPGLTGSYGAK